MQQIRRHAAVRRRALFLLTSSNEVRPIIGLGLQGDYSGSGGNLAGSGYSLTFWITGGGWSLSRILLFLLAARERTGKQQGPLKLVATKYPQTLAKCSSHRTITRPHDIAL
jgi:hypothetical protein